MHTFPELRSNNTDIFRELLANKTTNFFWFYIIIKQYWHFQRGTNKHSFSQNTSVRLLLKLFRLLGESLIYFFTYRSHQRCKKSVQKNVRAWQTSVSAIFLLNKITVQIFQIILIQNKTFNTCVKGLERRRKVKTRLQGLFTFWY